MLKEMMICIVIVVAIIFGNNITQNYTKESIETMSKSLDSLREELVKEEVDNMQAKQKVDEIYGQWEERHKKLAYYIEHNELEKIETGLTEMKSFIETEEYTESIDKLDTSAFLLKHVEDRYAFNLENIF